MLVAQGMDTRRHLSSWLAGVFVDPEHRRHGVGAPLVHRVVDEATAPGVNGPYLYTPIHSEHRALLPYLGWSLGAATSQRVADVEVLP